MSYSGKTHAGGPAQVRDLPHVTISKMAVGPLDNNVYLLRAPDDVAQLLIDPAAEPDRIVDLCGGAPTTIVVTHRHQDHWGALAQVRARIPGRTLAHAEDADAIPGVDDVLTDQDTLTVGEAEFEVIHLVGHTPGSIALGYRDPEGHPHLFTGDALFPGGVGRTVNPADFRRLFTDVSRKIFDRYPDETWVYPGHGNDTTLGAERPHLAEWEARGW